MIAPAQRLIPQIWGNVLIKACKRNLEAPNPFEEVMAAWEQEHVKRMGEDPEYAKAYEESEREWMEMNERWEDDL